MIMKEEKKRKKEKVEKALISSTAVCSSRSLETLRKTWTKSKCIVLINSHEVHVVESSEIEANNHNQVSEDQDTTLEIIALALAIHVA